MSNLMYMFKLVQKLSGHIGQLRYFDSQAVNPSRGICRPDYESSTLSVKPVLTAILLALGIQFGFSQNSADTVKLLLDFPVIDMPYQRLAGQASGSFLGSFGYPSMAQSLALSNNLYASAHYGIKSLINPKSRFAGALLRGTAVAGFDVLSLFIPLGNGWLHEEYHRAVMARRAIASFNEINTFPIGQSVVYVSRIKDEDLVRLYNNHRPDFVRLMSAGIEAQYQQNQLLQKHNFYYRQNLPHVLLYWLNAANSASYVSQSANSEEFDEIVDNANQKENDIKQRDFTGPDFTAWVEALFNPDRLYQARGVHPSGVGINRYIKPSQLSDDEAKFLMRQGNLQWLNLLSPHMFGISRIRLSSGSRGDRYGNFAVRHFLTSFGNDITLDLFYQGIRNNLFFTVHNYNNFNKSFWGLEGALIDKMLLNDRLLMSGTAMIWSQPKSQSFTSTEGQLGGLLHVRGAYGLGNWYPYVELEGKTAGWVMGNVFLDDNLSVRCGVSLRLQ